jgi:hypothetical protein
MLFIAQTPTSLQAFFQATVVQATVPQQQWLIDTTLAMALSMGRRTVKGLSALMDPNRARSSLNDFFSQSPWPAADVLQRGTLWVLDQMNLQPGEDIFFILDPTQKAKRGTKMDALGWIKEARSEEWRRGHRILLGYLRVRGVMLPWAVDLYLSKKFLASPSGEALKARRPGLAFRTMNEMAAEMIEMLPEEWGHQYNVKVLLDSGFCNDIVPNAALACGFQVVVAAQSNRVLVKSTKAGELGKRVKLGRYAPGRLRYQGRGIRLPPKRPGGRHRDYRIAEAMGTLRGLGEVKVVFSQRRSDGSILCLVSTDVDADARAVASAYGWRWEIEVAIKGLKQRLGLGQYQCRYYEGMVHHLHLSLLAHLVLTFAELQRRGQKAYKRTAALNLPSIRVLQIRIRQRVWRDLAARLRVNCRDHEFVNRFERALEAC